MDKNQEPYEAMPEGDPHATANFVAKIVTGLMLIIVISVLAACPAHAEGHNWCGDWADGYVVGFCWSRTNCDYIPPVVCPAPKDGQTDGYIVGLKDGLADGSTEI